MSESEVASGLTALGIDPASATGIRRLSGASGAGVFGLQLDGQPVVLKISTNPQPIGPGRELRFYRELADRIPLRTPQLLSSATSAESDILLLERAAAAAPPARDWSPATWIEVAEQLGRLHRAADAAELRTPSWLQPDRRPPATDERRHLWQASPCADVATPLLDALGKLELAATAPPTCLVHGDCHAENLLLDDAGDLIWTDWQEVTFRHGPEDLALLWQRAEFDRAIPPREAMVDAYVKSRGIRPDDTFRRAVTAAELRLLLIGWPAFLLQAPSPGRTALFDRLRALDEAWQLTR